VVAVVVELDMNFLLLDWHQQIILEEETKVLTDKAVHFKRLVMVVVEEQTLDREDVEELLLLALLEEILLINLVARVALLDGL
jgi:hypothetical protein